MKSISCDKCGQITAYPWSAEGNQVLGVVCLHVPVDIKGIVEFVMDISSSKEIDLCPPCLKQIVEQMASEIVPQMRNGNSSHASEKATAANQ